MTQPELVGDLRPQPESWARRVGLAPRRRNPVPAVVTAPTDAQITSLVESARRLAHRQRGLYAGLIMPSDAGERLLRLDWAVRAGESVLAARAVESARAVTHAPTGRATDASWLGGR